MAQLAIKGHPTRGKEVIEILEMLGGCNEHNYSADCDSLCFYIGKSTNIIYYDWVNNCYDDTCVFTLEYFLKKFPYKVGDKAIVYDKEILALHTVQDMRWNYTLNKVEYKICSSWLDVSIIQPYKEKTIEKSINKTNKVIFDANAQCCDIINDIIKKETMEEKLEQKTLDIPKGYEFFGINDDNQIVLTKKQIQYPKTYLECAKILGRFGASVYIDGYKGRLLDKLQELIICRDAYWKIAGEQMGLDKPWVPDSINGLNKYCLVNCGNHITKTTLVSINVILAFPTSEMRDAFKKNFDNDIEFCKEFL